MHVECCNSQVSAVLTIRYEADTHPSPDRSGNDVLMDMLAWTPDPSIVAPSTRCHRR
jgi:hypothetical protein